MIHDLPPRSTPTPEVIEKEFKMKPEEFDKQFLAWLDKDTQRDRRPDLDEWKKSIRSAYPRVRRPRIGMTSSKIQGTAIRDLYADYVEAANVYEFLVRSLPGKE